MKRPLYHEAIIEACSMRHLTAEEIFAELRPRFPSVGGSTVYRNVEELAEAGELRKITGIGKKALFERVVRDHVAHFVDRETGAVHDVEIPREWLYDRLPEGFIPESVDVRFYGRTTR